MDTTGFNNISNQNSAFPIYSDSSIDGLVKTSQTIGGHIDELDDTLGAERRSRFHPKGHREVWTQKGRDLTIFGENFTMVFGVEKVTVYGKVDITVIGECNTKVNGNYNLNITGDMNVSVKGNIVQKCDKAYVVETTSGDIFHNSGSQLRQDSVGDMKTTCRGEYKLESTSDALFNVPTATTTFIGKNFVCAHNEKIVMKSSISTISGDSLNLVGSLAINLGASDIGAINLEGSIINSKSNIINIDSPNTITTGTINGQDFISGAISLANHKHTSAASGSPTSTPIP